MSYPKFGTHPIKCGARKCSWTGYETDMGKDAQGKSTCPACGKDSYYFQSERQMKQSKMSVRESANEG